MSAPGHLKLHELVKKYDLNSSIRAVDTVSLDIAPGEFVTLLGPSGCGKTTLLRTVAGFVSPTSGQLMLDGKDLTRVPPNRRPVSMVFQSYALFPHMTVRDNVGYGLKAAGTKATQLRQQVDEALDLMSLGPFADRAPAHLSGGQQQRVALARAMVMRPQVMLFDEPLSNLDASLREQMRSEIRRLQRRLGTTALYVTHDQSEAMAVSDRVVVLNEGRIEQVGTPSQIYRRPASHFVAGFVGRANFLSVSVTKWDEGSAEVEVFGESRWVPAHLHVARAATADLLVRPESLQITPVDKKRGESAALARVTAMIFMGSRVDYELDWRGHRLLASVTDPDEQQIIAEGSDVELSFPSKRSWLLPSGV